MNGQQDNRDQYNNKPRCNQYNEQFPRARNSQGNKQCAYCQEFGHFFKECQFFKGYCTRCMVEGHFTQNCVNNFQQMPTYCTPMMVAQQPYVHQQQVFTQQQLPQNNRVVTNIPMMVPQQPYLPQQQAQQQLPQNNRVLANRFNYPQTAPMQTYGVPTMMPQQSYIQKKQQTAPQADYKAQQQQIVGNVNTIQHTSQFVDMESGNELMQVEDMTTSTQQ